MWQLLLTQQPKLDLNCTNICVNWGSLWCTVIPTRWSFFRKIMTPKLKTGDYVGYLINEMEQYGPGSFIQEFVSGGPKNYAFSVFCPSTGKRATKCKVKSITLKYENSKVVNFTTLRYMILDNAARCMFTIRRRLKGNRAV